jgi:hypothetical protein
LARDAVTIAAPWAAGKSGEERVELGATIING